VYAADGADAEGTCRKESIAPASYAGTVCCTSVAIHARSVQPAAITVYTGASAITHAANRGSRFGRDAAECCATTSDNFCDGTGTGCCCNEDFCAMTTNAHTVRKLLRVWAAWSLCQECPSDGAAPRPAPAATVEPDKVQMTKKCRTCVCQSSCSDVRPLHCFTLGVTHPSSVHICCQ